MSGAAAGAKLAPLECPPRLREAGIALRPAEAADAAFLRLLYHSTRWDELAPTQWPDAAKIAFLDQQASFQQRHYDTAFAGAEQLVVLAQGAPIGRFYLDRRSRTLRVVDISLLPDWRGRGLGAALLEMLQQEVRARRGESVELSVVATSPARRLYERLGFVDIDPDPEFPPLYIEMSWRPLS